MLCAFMMLYTSGFYKASGFQIEELIENFYSDDGGDAYVMWSYSIITAT